MPEIFQPSFAKTGRVQLIRSLQGSASVSGPTRPPVNPKCHACRSEIIFCLPCSLSPSLSLSLCPSLSLFRLSFYLINTLKIFADTLANYVRCCLVFRGKFIYECELIFYIKFAQRSDIRELLHLDILCRAKQCVLK